MEQLFKNLPQKINTSLKFKLCVLYIATGLLILDLVSKYFANEYLAGSPISIIDGFFSLTLAFNTGVSFSMFNNLESGAIILATVAVVAGAFLECLAFTSIKKAEIVGYSLISAGAYANGIDRFYNGHVIDFLDFYYKNWHYPTFNFADCFIFIGVAIILLEGFFNKKTKEI